MNHDDLLLIEWSFELNFCESFLNWILNWINFGQNSNIELNQFGYRTGLCLQQWSWSLIIIIAIKNRLHEVILWLGLVSYCVNVCTISLYAIWVQWHWKGHQQQFHFGFSYLSNEYFHDRYSALCSINIFPINIEQFAQWRVNHFNWCWVQLLHSVIYQCIRLVIYLELYECHTSCNMYVLRGFSDIRSVDLGVSISGTLSPAPKNWTWGSLFAGQLQNGVRTTQKKFKFIDP